MRIMRNVMVLPLLILCCCCRMPAAASSSNLLLLQLRCCCLSLMLLHQAESAAQLNTKQGFAAFLFKQRLQLTPFLLQ